jgi:Putative lumazine-binding
MLSDRLLPRLVIFSGLTLALSGPTLAAKSVSPEEKAVLVPLQALLDGLARRDKAGMAAQLLPGGGATLMRSGKPVQMGFDAFVERLSAPGTDTREERIHNPLIRIDDNIAIIWTRFVFVLNGKVDHCGTDIVNLVKADGRWLISSIGDTSRTACTK